MTSVVVAIVPARVTVRGPSPLISITKLRLVASDSAVAGLAPLVLVPVSAAGSAVPGVTVMNRDRPLIDRSIALLGSGAAVRLSNVSTTSLPRNTVTLNRLPGSRLEAPTAIEMLLAHEPGFSALKVAARAGAPS